MQTKITIYSNRSLQRFYPFGTSLRRSVPFSLKGVSHPEERYQEEVRPGRCIDKNMWQFWSVKLCERELAMLKALKRKFEMISGFFWGEGGGTKSFFSFLF